MEHTCDECPNRRDCILPELAISTIDSMTEDPFKALLIVKDSFEELAGEEKSDTDEYMMFNYLVRYYKAKVVEKIYLN